MDTDRRRDLGEGDRVRAEPPRGQSVRPGTGPHDKRLRRRLRRHEVSARGGMDDLWTLKKGGVGFFFASPIKVRLTPQPLMRLTLRFRGAF